MVDFGQRGASGAQRRLDAFNAAHAQRKLPYYDLLGVPETATQSDIVRAFRRLSLKLHPDKPGGSNEAFQSLNKAYKCLRDPENRRKYDDCGFDEDNISTDEVDEFVDAFFGETARNLDGRSPDWSMGAIANYVRIDLAEVPLHMKDIVRIGLNYIVALDHDFENVVLLQHSRVDILYLMVGLFNEGDLTQDIFASEESYPITYYDNPLQPGILPRWSDQNVLGSKKHKKKEVPRRELNIEEFQRRQKHALAMLENAPLDPMTALEEKYRVRMLAEQHKLRSIADARRCEAVRGLDVYEDDAELDCNAYAASFQNAGAVATSPVLDPTRVAQDVYGGDAELDCTEYAETRSQEINLLNAKDAVKQYESQGTDDVVGFNSDGVLFVAKDGRVLRNEGPPRPS
mmetsp:Transcript_105703/g.297298  ORF Transcript_105703/g.297298 Transcript_105703/m.297298 type:complete len:401 (-) Transcript_105703:99-1301(-)